MAKLRTTLKMTGNNTDLGRRLAAAGTAGRNRAADFLVVELRKAVSTPHPRPIRNRRNADAGRPPFLRTGEGMRSIRRTAAGRISMLAYMAYLEFGTRRIQARPWYRVTIERLKIKIAQLAAGK
jgi:hypothetical protein